MTELRKPPKIEKEEKGLVIGPEEEIKSLDEVRKAKVTEKGIKPSEKRKRKFWKAELGKTPEELREESQEELEKAREEIEKKLGIGEKKEEPKKEEPDKKKERMKEILKETVKAGIPEKYKKYIGDLIGRDDEKALEIRDRIPVLKYQAMAFAGTASPESRQFVEDNIENRTAWSWLPFALMGDNTEKGWILRRALEIDTKLDKDGIKKSESVRGGRWWEWIEKFGLHKSKGFEGLVDNINSLTPWPRWFLAPYHILKSTTGIRLDESPEKVALIEKYGKFAPRAALECLKGDNSALSQKKAEEIYFGGDPELNPNLKGDPRLKDLYKAYLKSREGYEKS